MEVTLDQLASMSGVKPNANMRSVKAGLDESGKKTGLDAPHRLAQYLAQLLHESGDFRYDREIWGPTAAQQRYDTRTDLGNSPAKDGDGERYKGRTAGQITGKDNYRRFTTWARRIDPSAPDFVAVPDKLNTDPWEGLGPIWYWDVGNPTGNSLNRYADEANIEQITKKINGGLNGYADRVANYTKAALVLLGYGPTQVREFQTAAQKQGLLPPDEPGKPPQVDGDAGPVTRSALHMALVKMGARKTPAVKAAPVTEDKPVAVAPEGADKRGGLWGWGSAGIGSVLVSIGGGFMDLPIGWKIAIGVVSLASIAFLLWRGELVVRRIKAIVSEIEA